MNLLPVASALLGLLLMFPAVMLVPMALFISAWMHVPMVPLLASAGPPIVLCAVSGAWLFRWAHRRSGRRDLQASGADGDSTRSVREGRWTRWIALCMVALVCLSIAPLFEDLVSCGLGPPPGAPGYEQHVQAQEEQRRTLGYQPVCEGYMRHFNYASRAEPLHEATRRLAFTPVSLESTLFRDLKPLGGRPDFFGDEGAAALHRTFRTPQGFIVDLREWDLSVSGGQVWSRAELQTERVNGAPAQLTVLQAPSGRAASTLAWTEGQRRYELFVNANVKTIPVTPTLLDLASSLPKSVPARIDEGPPAFPGSTLPLQLGE